MQTQSVPVDEKLCSERRKVFEKTLEEHNDWLENHENRIGNLEKYQSKAEEQVKNLCGQIKALVKAMWWFMGVFVTAMLSFFIWYIQSLPR